MRNMASTPSKLDEARLAASRTIQTNDQAILRATAKAAPSGGRLTRGWEDGVGEQSEFERSLRTYPPGPQVFDLTKGDAAQMRRADISHLRPGDTVVGQGAVIRMDDRGAPIVNLRPGFENGRSAARVGPAIIGPLGPPGVSVDDNISTASGRGPFWFRRQVPKGAPWDYKQRDPVYEAFGNYNYGATGRAIPFPTLILEQEAGRAQVRDGNSQAGWGSPGPHLAPFLGSGSFGDDPVDQYWIEQGARYHDGR